PRYAARHPFQRRLRDSLLLERLLGFDPRALDPDIRSTLRCREEMDHRCRSRGVAYLTATFAAPDVSKARKDMRQHLDTNIAFWTRYYPIRSFPLYAAILARHNSELAEFTAQHGMRLARVHEQLMDPALFIDACHLTPEGIAKLAEALLPAVAEIVEGRPAFRRWAAGGR
ncbi:MAG TPA: hypothetical protein VMV21_20735, partial [Vicinamibacteria bacterium]|nr:hypothetical protein [Vicinamibacteria bacterium]